MNQILSVILTSMHADLARAERAAMNIANVQSPGYKRQFVSASAFAAHMEAGGAALAAPGPDAVHAAYTVHTDMRAGTLKTTGQRLDLAITGEGWFEVATEQGPAYTRQGNFRLDATGRLVTQQGHAVMGLAGEIQLGPGMPVIDAAGRVFDGDRAEGTPGATPVPVGQLKVVQFAPLATVHRLGDGLVAIEGEATPARHGSVQVQQGVLENSNVSHMHEMVRLMETVRHLESLQKVAIGYDEMLATAIRRLGEP